MDSSKRNRAILHIDMDTFFCSVERLRDPGLEGIPLIVGGNPNQRGVVATASYEAREFGIHSAMPLREAARLCPHAIFVPPHFDAYLYYSRLILDILEEYSPVVEPAGIDEAYVDLTGSRAALGKPAEVAQRMRKDIREKLGLPSSAGLSTSKIVSKIASDIAKPDGFIEVPPGEEKQLLAGLPIEKLPGVGGSCKAILANIGVNTIGDLSLIPPEVLEGALGFQGRILAEHAKGIDRRSVEARGEPKSISRETTYQEDTTDLEMVRSTLLFLSEKCCFALRSSGLETGRVTVKIRYRNFVTRTKSRALPTPTDREQVIYRVACELLQKLPKRETAHRETRSCLWDGTPVRLVGVSLSDLSPALRQGELFPGFAPEENDVSNDGAKMERLTRSVDYIRKRHGFSAISRGSTMGLSPRGK